MFWSIQAFSYLFCFYSFFKINLNNFLYSKSYLKIKKYEIVGFKVSLFIFEFVALSL